MGVNIFDSETHHKSNYILAFTFAGDGGGLHWHSSINAISLLI